MFLFYEMKKEKVELLEILSHFFESKDAKSSMLIAINMWNYKAFIENDPKRAAS